METKQCTLYGYLYGALCDDLPVWDRIGGAEVVAVASQRDTPTLDSLARPNRGTVKLAVHDIDEKHYKSMAADAIMRGTTDANGVFCFSNPDYTGGLIDLYVCIDRIPTPTVDEGFVTLKERCYLALGTYAPFKFGDTWYLITVVPSVVWCRVRQKADLWVIVGRVTPCADKTVGLGKLTVTAKDADIVQHDVLGTAVTNNSGIFRIDYPGSKFRQGTWIDVELFGGPDVFFEIKDEDGIVRLDESPAVGRRSGRCNRGPCFCVALCIEVEVPPVGPVPTAWTKVGSGFTIPDSSSLNDFDADGYGWATPPIPALAPKLNYAFHGSPRMVGSAPRVTNSGNPVEYRFLVSDVTTPNNGAPPPDAAFSRIVGAGADVGLFATTLIGQMQRAAPFKIVDIYAIQSDLDTQGWLDVNTSIQRTFAAHPTLTPADIPDFQWIDLDSLMRINTAGLTTAPNVPSTAGQAGDAVLAGDRIGIEKKAIRFEIREVVDKATNTFNTMSGSGTTLNAIVLNNNPIYAKVAMTEHLSGVPCDPLKVPPHVAYTVHHPHLAYVNVKVRSNDGAYNQDLSDGTTSPGTSDAPIQLANNTNPGINHLHNPAADVPTTGLKKCTYIVTLTALPKLHTGDGAALASTPQTSFYYEP